MVTDSALDEVEIGPEGISSCLTVNISTYTRDLGHPSSIIHHRTLLRFVPIYILEI